MTTLRTRSIILSSFAWLLPIALLLFVFSDRRIPIYDGGLPLSLALRVLHGEVPHRDFYYQYGPAQPFLFATLFRLFGVNMLAITISEMLIKSGTVVLSYLVVRSVASRWAALYTAVLTAQLMITSYPSAGMDVLLVVAAFLILNRNVLTSRPTIATAFCTGVLAGLAGFFRYEQGPMLLLLYVLLTGLWWLRTREKPDTTRALCIAVGCAVCGYLLLTIPLFVYFAQHHAVRDLVWQCFEFSRLHYVAARHLPFPLDPWRHVEEVVFYLPILLPPLALVYLAWRSRQAGRTQSRSSVSLIVTLAILAMFYASKGIIRVDFGQMLPANFALAMLLAVLTGREHPRLVRNGAFTGALILFAGTLLFCKGLVRTWQKQGTLSGQLLLQPGASHDVAGWCSLPLPMSQPVCFNMPADHERAVLFLAGRIHQGDRLFVGLRHHDRVYAGDNLTYFATDTLPAVKWSHFDPDLQTSAEIQTSMIQDLERYHPGYAVETAEFEGNREPNDSSKSSGVFLLDDYIQSHYEPVQSFGLVTVLQRRTSVGDTHAGTPAVGSVTRQQPGSVSETTLN